MSKLNIDQQTIYQLFSDKKSDFLIEELVCILQPHTILVFGSAKYPCFIRLGEQGINVIAYPGNTASAFDKRRRAGGASH